MTQAPGGGGEAKAAAKAKNSQRSGTDPLLVHDPWAKAAAASSRWEDLKLEDHHPFQDSKGEQLAQYHRLQTSTTTKGVVLDDQATLAGAFETRTQATSHCDPASCGSANKSRQQP